VQAAVTSAASFAIGVAAPLLAAAVSPATPRSIVIAAVTLVALCILGAVGASLGGASRVRGSLRIGVGGGIAMVVTYGVGALFGTVTG